jgi:hypothetical protein
MCAPGLPVCTQLSREEKPNWAPAAFAKAPFASYAPAGKAAYSDHQMNALPGSPKALASNIQSLTFSQYQYSNRQSYEKLEVHLNPLSSTNVPVLIDTKTHFVQGKIAQFQCNSPERLRREKSRLLRRFRFSLLSTDHSPLTTAVSQLC